MILKSIVPDGWQCSLEDAPPGPFVSVANPNLLCFKSEYSDESGPIAYNSAGERYHGGGPKTVVQPVEMIIEERE